MTPLRGGAQHVLQTRVWRRHEELAIVSSCDGMTPLRGGAQHVLQTRGVEENQRSEAHTRTHTHTHIHTHIHTHTYTHIHTCTHTHMHACTHMHTHMHACTHMHTHMHTHTCTHTHMHTHAHTHAHYFILLGGGATFCRAAISKCSLTMSNKCFTGSVTEWYILCKVHEWIGFFLTP